MFLFVQNAHAYVNAGFYMEVDTTNYTVKGKPSLVFGGISTHGVSTQTHYLYLNQAFCSGFCPNFFRSCETKSGTEFVASILVCVVLASLPGF